MVVSIADVFQYFLQNGLIEVGFLGGAQIDQYGNINTTTIGSYSHPTVRLPGSGGAAEIATHAHRTLVMSRLSKRAFPATVDFHTSPGHRYQGRSRAELGMPGAGPVKVITDKALLAANTTTGELELDAVYPNVKPDEVQQQVGWELEVRNPLNQTEPPTSDELRILRDILDPNKIYLEA